VGRFKARLSFQTLLSLLLLTTIVYSRQLIRLEDTREMEKHLGFNKKESEQWVGDEKREETEYVDDTESEESDVSTDGWKGKGREQVSFHFSHISSNALISAHAQRLTQNCSPAELFSTSWIDITVSPALSEMPITPGDQIEFSIALKEGINLVGFEARLVGRSELANVSR